MNIQTYLFFDGNCEEAIQLYGDVFDAKVEFLMRFNEGPPNVNVPGMENKIFHATIVFGETALNMADVPSSQFTDFGGFALLAHVATVEEAERAFHELGKEGQVRMPLQTTFWALRYGIVIDRFSITWKIQVNK